MITALIKTKMFRTGQLFFLSGDSSYDDSGYADDHLCWLG